MVPCWGIVTDRRAEHLDVAITSDELYTSLKFNMVHLKISPWKRRLRLRKPSFSDSMLNFGGVYNISAKYSLGPTCGKLPSWQIYF